MRQTILDFLVLVAVLVLVIAAYGVVGDDPAEYGERLGLVEDDP